MLCAGLRFESHVLLQSLKILIRYLCRQTGQDLTLEAHPGFKDVVGLGQARLGNGRPLVRLQIH